MLLWNIDYNVFIEKYLTTFFVLKYSLKSHNVLQCEFTFEFEIYFLKFAIKFISHHSQVLGAVIVELTETNLKAFAFIYFVSQLIMVFFNNTVACTRLHIYFQWTIFIKIELLPSFGDPLHNIFV